LPNCRRSTLPAPSASFAVKKSTFYRESASAPLKNQRFNASRQRAAKKKKETSLGRRFFESSRRKSAFV
jgi:hypothetical protein